MPSSMPRINWIEIQGFRAFGKNAQRIDLSSSISVLWGPNSQGKTSFAEAVEFLFTGAIVRKDLLASGHDEFADSLRNTHLPSNKTVYVEAEIKGGDGAVHSVRRTLASDFSKKGNCTSTVEIDGKPAAAEGFAKIGIKLSQPPMAVPILMQHTLGYLFTAKPSERSLYFKAILEISDLDLLRNKISQRETLFSKPDSVLITKVKAAAGIDNPDVKNSLAPLLNLDQITPNVAQQITQALDALIWSAGSVPPLDVATKIEFIEHLLQQKQAKTFPLIQFKREAFVASAVAADTLEASLNDFGEQSNKVDAEVKQLTNLFTEVLKIPAVADKSGTIDCPVCGTEDALTAERLQIIRQKLETSQAYVGARETARASLQQVDATLDMLERKLRGAAPAFGSLTSRQRKEIGFSIGRIRELLPQERHDKLQVWFRELRLFLRDMQRVTKITSETKAMATQDITTFAATEAVEKLRKSVVVLKKQQNLLVEREKAYAEAEQSLKDELRPIVDAKSSTAGWQDLLDIAKDQNELLSDLIDMKARAVVRGELAKAVQEIDRAKEEVMNDKFADMSQEIKDWWERLRPDEPVFFSGVKPRPQTVRTIDFKVGLAATSERLNPHVRDVIAIFSMSQMHCLGLAAFLARSVREKCGFVILDDPILSSDEDHRTNFMHGGLEALVAAGYQVILLTQDQSLRKTLGHLYAHLNIDLFEITMNTPADGCEVNKTSDSISAMLARVKPFVGNTNLEMRKSACEKLRDIAERVCKEIIVNNRRQNGDPTAALTDYTGKNGTLEHLISDVEQYLNEKNHPGKLKVIAQTLNPGKHDDDVPTKEALKQAFGDLGGFRKQYSLS